MKTALKAVALVLVCSAFGCTDEHGVLLSLDAPSEVESVRIQVLDPERMEVVWNRDHMPASSANPRLIGLRFTEPTPIVLHVSGLDESGIPIAVGSRCFTVDGVVEEDMTLVRYQAGWDEDGDGFVSDSVPRSEICRSPGAAVNGTPCSSDRVCNPIAPNSADLDCDDTNPNIYPGAPDPICGDGVSFSCGADVGCMDADGDGYGPCVAGQTSGCDCDEGDPLVNPDAIETPCVTTSDLNCDGEIPACDGDGDGVPACRTGVPDGECDCDDDNPDISPLEPEDRCGTAENDDCDGFTNEGCANPTDQDGDGYDTCMGSTSGCDCNDCDPAINQDASEACDNSVDDDCDGMVDEGCSDPDDRDNDGIVNPNDCEPDDPRISPRAKERCDERVGATPVDDDCDGDVDETCAEPDGDGDGYADSDDCAPEDEAGFPFGTEQCNGIDDDCDGRTDETVGTRIDGCIQSSDGETQREPVDFNTTLTNCGMCQNLCDVTRSNICSGGGCVCDESGEEASCEGEELCCGGQGCRDLGTSMDACGECGLSCNGDRTDGEKVANACSAGACVCDDQAACEDDTVCCDGSGCIDLQTDVTHCGSCDNACSFANAEAACERGACKVDSCTGTFADCDSDPMTCETDTSTSDAHCGRCGNSCVRDGGTRTCQGGTCSDITCDAPLANCDGDVDNGCEINTANDVEHCGACDMECSLPNATPRCQSSGCRVDSCDSGWGNCDDSQDNGCESNLRNDVAHCGDCGTRCSFNQGTAACSGGSCELTGCMGNFANCDGNDNNGCESNTQNNVNHCGGCDNKCELPNASEACMAGGCVITSCNAGFADCDGNPANGCEVNTRTDTNNCGGCGDDCPNVAGATVTCGGGSCQVDCGSQPYCSGSQSCEECCNSSQCSSLNSTTTAGQGVCTSNECVCSDGAMLCDGKCEQGDCCEDSDCGSRETCDNFTCRPNCTAPFDDCDSDPDNACQDLRVDADHCGACGNDCEEAAVNISSADCRSSECVYECTGPYLDCDPDPGCESNMNTTNAHCGACGNQCAPGKTCQNGECCQPGMMNCD